ncbi:DUF3822 family protein [Chryseobacterium vrystaatense]|uniref:DUF3822 domain-containing protein n=1 Tax=Chryseobacterium vrystaatense TaxID=307480 RepID=A0A1M4YRC7_9FLAO|nr:DUF3822 family protein [Chryseobacterium vrystaatense]SHF07896.1 Protein of unknown function [Chryseobacterium vrystaatense]
MNVLNLLFTKDGLICQIAKNKSILEEKSYFVTEETADNLIEDKLDEILLKQRFEEIHVISALNHFTLMPEGFSEHDAGFELIAFNAPADRDKEELMLSVNKRFGVQFYYTFPKNFYKKIKELAVPVHFNFSGEKFLNSINNKNNKEIHINLYHNQCEFFAIDNKKVILYNNLDVNSEVDFLYFVMFTLSKIGFGINETSFYAYGETTENETFISELQKFVKNMRIVYDNVPNKNFILN